MSEKAEWHTKPCSVHGHCLLIGPSTGKHEFSLQMPTETAELIALACNSQPALLAACERHKKIVVEGYGNTVWDANYADMEAALALAKG